MLDKNTNELLLDFKSPCGQFNLIFEDDGKVAYAYLKEGSNIVADVWLYNRCDTPNEPEWKDRSKIPFALSKDYMLPDGKLVKPVGSGEVQVDWEDDELGIVAYVYVYEDLFGVLGPGDKPGYARYAAKDSPLAKVLVTE